jgi:transcriptional/translational regulatory protein YebC/TACO1
VEVGQRVLRLLTALEDHDDVQGVHANYEFTMAVAEALAKES